MLIIYPTGRNGRGTLRDSRGTPVFLLLLVCSPICMCMVRYLQGIATIPFKWNNMKRTPEISRPNSGARVQGSTPSVEENLLGKPRKTTEKFPVYLNHAGRNKYTRLLRLLLSLGTEITKVLFILIHLEGGSDTLRDSHKLKLSGTGACTLSAQIPHHDIM